MIAFPSCKINLGLSVLNKRSDGFHNVETVFYPLPLSDVLEIVIPTDTSRPDELSRTGLPIDGQPEHNLCLKALRLLKADFPAISPVRMHLHKMVPLGAGLGGGSADGTATLVLLNKVFNLNIPSNRLAEYALLLGSDCPFFLHNKPCFARGRGEQLQEIALDLSAWHLTLVNPGIHINTAWAFSSVVPTAARGNLQQSIQEPVSAWKDTVVNDFEAPVFELYPEIKELRDLMYREGAIYSAMSGTGSTVFGLFEKKTILSLPPAYTQFNLGF